MGPITLSGPAPISGNSSASLTGKVMGGNLPITGATIQLYAAGAPAMPSGSNPATGSYGGGATALIPTGSMTANSTNNYYNNTGGTNGNSGCAIAADGSNPNGCTALPETNSNGYFSVTGDYSCTQGQSIYIVSTGGNSGVTSEVNNSAIALMAGLGTCPASGSLASAYPSLNINEVTTIATVWALQQFLEPPTGVAASGYVSQGGSTSGAGVSIGAPSGPAGGYGGVQTAIVGMQNGFLMIPNLANLSSGLSTAPTNSWATPESAKINTLANIISSCVNSTSNASSQCSSLFSDATPNGSTPAADTIQAAYYMARNPLNNVTTLTGLSSGYASFAPTTTPTDFTVAVGVAPTYTYNSTVYPAINSTYTLTVDGYGDIWVGNTLMDNPPTQTSTTDGSVVELAPDGSLLMNPVFGYNVNTTGGVAATGVTSQATVFTTSGQNAFESMAVDTAGNVWVPNSRGVIAGDSSDSSVAEFTASSRSATTNLNTASTGVENAYYTTNNPYGISVDGSDNVYVAISANKIDAFQNGSGSEITSAAGASSWTQATAVDTRGYLWVVASHACETTSPSTVYGGALYQYEITTAAGSAANGTPTLQPTFGKILSATPAGNASQLNQCNTTSNSNVQNAVTATETINAVTNTPYGIAVDRNNNLWVTEAASGASGGITFIGVNSDGTIGSTSSNSLTLSPGTNTYGLGTPSAVAVDGNNNAWVANNTGDYLSEFSATTSTSGTSPVVTTVSSINSLAGNTGYYHDITGAKISSPKAIAVDPTGNVWLTSNGTSAYVTAIVGVAAPTVTPLSVAAKNNAIGIVP